MRSSRKGSKKLHFNLDLKYKNMKTPTLKYAELIKDYLIKDIIDYFAANIKETLFIQYDIMVFTLHRENSYLYHIIVDNFAFSTSAHCKEVIKKI